MSTWHTSRPAPSDYPVWAYVDNEALGLILVRTEYELPEGLVTWCKAEIPTPPDNHVASKYYILEKSEVTLGWSAFEWFKAGYQYGKSCKGLHGCNKGAGIRRGNGESL